MLHGPSEDANRGITTPVYVMKIQATNNGKSIEFSGLPENWWKH